MNAIRPSPVARPHRPSGHNLGVTGIGRTLQAAREAHGLTIDQAVAGSRLPRATLIALEADAFGEFPAPVYYRNALRQYAAWLGLPAEPLVARYPGQDTAPRMDAPGWLARPSRGWGIWLAGAGVAVLMLAVLYVLYQAYRPVDTTRQVGPVIAITIPTPTPLPAAEAAPGPAAAAPTPAPARTPTPLPGTSPAAKATPQPTATPAPTTAPQAIPVPAVTGTTAAAAESQLRSAGFGVSRQEAFSATVPAGTVMEQNPPAGTARQRGDTVIIVVSRGPQGTTVPAVVGLPEAQALAALQAAGLRVASINRQGRDQLPDAVRAAVCVGCVLSTTPAPGTAVAPGSPVNVAIRAE